MSSDSTGERLADLDVRRTQLLARARAMELADPTRSKESVESDTIQQLLGIATGWLNDRLIGLDAFMDICETAMGVIDRCITAREAVIERHLKA